MLLLFWPDREQNIPYSLCMIQYRTVPYRTLTIQYIMVLYGAILYGAVPCVTVPYRAVPYRTLLLLGTTPWTTTRIVLLKYCINVRDRTVRYGATWHGTVRQRYTALA